MNRRLTRIALTAALAVVVTAAVVSSANAAPQVLIREVHRGPTADSDYVMLQMTADGQNNLAGNYIDFLGADGMAGGEYQLPNVPNGQNQRTVLIGNTGVVGADFSDAGVANQPDGAVCLSTHGGYDGTNGFDCVAWGNFTGTTHPLSSPALPTVLGGVGLAPDQTLQRTIARGCPTALDAADDTNNSDNDFSLVPTPNPRGNSLVASENLCTGTGTKPPANSSTTKKCKKKKHRSAETAKKKKCKKKKHH
jgi:hypothetical protein